MMLDRQKIGIAKAKSEGKYKVVFQLREVGERNTEAPP